MMDCCIKKLREKGVKITPKRKAIIRFFLGKDRSFTPENVWIDLKKEYSHFGLPSVYRNLEVFERCNILMKVDRSDRRLRYALANSQGNCKYQIVCVKCEKVEDLPQDYFAQRKSINGFKILNHRLQVEGICPHCKENNND